MLSKKRRGVSDKTAPNNNQLQESYRNSASVSRVKLQIGELLLALQTPLNRKQERNIWVLFESKLRQYYDLKVSG